MSFSKRQSAEKIGVVFLDSHVSTRELLARELLREGGFAILGSASTGDEGLALCRRKTPALVIMDLLLDSGLRGVEVIRRLPAEPKKPRLLIYTAVTSDELVVEARRESPHGFVRKQDSLSTLLEAVRVVAGGGLYFTKYSSPQGPAPVRVGSGRTLTPRELAVLRLIAAGRRTKEIASDLDISLKTAEHHRANLMDKLGLREVASLTRYAITHGHVDLLG